MLNCLKMGMSVSETQALQYERFFAAYEEAHRENWEAKPLLSIVK